jgi:hypothetical protein
MGTNALSEPSVGELRYIARLVDLPEAYKEGEVSDITGGEVIEGSDVFLVDGGTRSKVCRNYSVTLSAAPNEYPSSTRPNGSSTTMSTAHTGPTAPSMRASSPTLVLAKSPLAAPFSETST